MAVDSIGAFRSAPPPAPRRLIVLDPGAHALKALLVEAGAGSIRVLARRQLVWREAGGQDAATQVQAVVEEFGAEPAVVVLPQNVFRSQVIDLPPGESFRPVEDTGRTRAGEAEESPLLVEQLPLPPFAGLKHPHWVMLAAEEALQEFLTRHGLSGRPVHALTATGSALAHAPRAGGGGEGLCALADLGAAGTTVTLALDGQPIATAVIAVSGAQLLESLAAGVEPGLDPEPERAEPGAVAGLRVARPREAAPVVLPALQRWGRELERALETCLHEHPQLSGHATNLRVRLTGGLAGDAVLVAALQRHCRLPLEPWLGSPAGDFPVEPEFAAAWGAAAEWLLPPPRTCGLLPAGCREVNRRRRWHLRLLAAISVLLALVAVLLAAGAGRKFSILSEQERTLAELRTAVTDAQEAGRFETANRAAARVLGPVLNRHEQTLDALRVLSLLQTTRTNNAWAVLVADHESYLAGSTLPPPPATNGTARLAPASGGTNVTANAWRGLVAELVVPAGGDALRATASQLVNAFKEPPWFRNVDTLSADLRQAWANPNVTPTNRSFALKLELGDTPAAALEAAIPAQPVLRPESPAGLRLRGSSPENSPATP